LRLLGWTSQAELKNFAAASTQYGASVTTLMPHGIVMASGNRLSLLLLSKLILKKSRPFSTVTTEAEALEAIGILQPGLLFVVSPLEEGDAISTCSKTRQLAPKLKIILFWMKRTAGQPSRRLINWWMR
jgi:hypothetical protein